MAEGVSTGEITLSEGVFNRVNQEALRDYDADLSTLAEQAPGDAYLAFGKVFSLLTGFNLLLPSHIIWKARMPLEEDANGKCIAYVNHEPRDVVVNIIRKRSLREFLGRQEPRVEKALEFTVPPSD